MNWTGYVRCVDCCYRIRDPETKEITGCKKGADWYRYGERVPCGKFATRTADLTVSPCGIEPKDIVYRCDFCGRSFTGIICPECGTERYIEDDELIEDEYDEEGIWNDSEDFEEEEE